jgi:hypothetical protein
MAQKKAQEVQQVTNIILILGLKFQDSYKLDFHCQNTYF